MSKRFHRFGASASGSLPVGADSWLLYSRQRFTICDVPQISVTDLLGMDISTRQNKDKHHQPEDRRKWER